MDEDDSFFFRDENHSNKMLQGFNELRKSNMMCDLLLCVDGVEFSCHRLVLASFSGYFRTMFTTLLNENPTTKEVVNGVEPAIISLLLDYAYTAELTITKHNVQSLMSAAHLLDMQAVFDACGTYMEENMDISNCINVHLFADLHGCTQLADNSKAFVLNRFQDIAVSNQEEFLNLDATKLIEFLESDELNVEQEDCVFLFVMSWYLHDPEGHEEHLEDVLEHVRLPLCSVYFLHDTVAKQEVVRRSARCMQLVEEAKTFHLLPDRRQDLCGPRTRLRKSSANMEVVVCVGGEDDKVVLRSVEYYSPHTSTWLTLACVPCAISKHGLVISGNSMYVIGGELPDGSPCKTVWKYDPCFDVWIDLEQMDHPRAELGVALVDGFIYVIGGWSGEERLRSVECFDIKNNKWKEVSELPVPVTSPAVVAHDGLLYVMGGAIGDDDCSTDRCQSYYPHSGVWCPLNCLLTARSGAVACVVQACIYVVGGIGDGGEYLSSVECYDIRLKTWKTCASMSKRRYHPAIAVLDGKIYVFGGEEGVDGYHDTVECYDVEESSWQVVFEMPTGRSWLSCGTLLLPRDIQPMVTPHSAGSEQSHLVNRNLRLSSASNR